MSLFEKKINVLFECNSCRDYAFAQAFSKSPILENLFIFGNNTLAKAYGTSVNMNSHNFLNFAKEKNINLFISFNEANTLMGLINYYKYNLKTPSIGATRYWFYLEASKRFAKNFMLMNGILTPNFIELHSVDELNIAINKFGFPFMLKFNGLSAGFGSYKVNNVEEAKTVITNLASRSQKEHISFKCTFEFDNDIHVIAEEYIDGEEISLLALWDGKTLKSFLPIKDYKKALNGDKGPNTGGIGGYMPYNLSYEKSEMLDEYIRKLRKIFIDFKPNFTGFIYSGIIFSNNRLYVLEYNMRPGDPEGQILSSHLDIDLLTLLYATSIEQLDKINIKYKEGVTGCVVLSNKDYYNDIYKIPGEIKQYSKSIIHTDNISKEINLFYGSTLFNKSNNCFISETPTRLINFCNTSKDPFKIIYNQLDKLKYENIYYRTDIGK